ncbi:imidazoleglycerol-phosphate dehydratase [Candidatus Nasuia deltocephalinicola str. NAS-ALF]|uniref:Imidazoleglycerol-phosphate dehydratase n=1 Tax=Candidatus Nasuia deltocephalinicola str. NAS-ALF TaxID=1343077 RepID=S5TE27_9PROT|nr:imidazoleglycerol-phosphate dehydratase [Candidatus Nasuia deltocephalinicola str. NAS-ALF]
MYFIYEYFRKTKETYISLQYFFKNIDNIKNNINIDLLYLRHMIDQISINSLIKINMNFIGDIKLDYHHSVEDIGIIMGKLFKYFINIYYKNRINRYGFYYVPLDDSLSRTVIDISGRSYLSYNLFYYNLYISNFNINLFYDFFLSLSNNSNITLYIDNLVGFNIHHIFESIFKSFGRSMKIALSLKKNKNTTKGIIF